MQKGSHEEEDEAHESKKRARFHDDEDIALLQEVCRLRLFSELRGAVGAAWEKVANNINSYLDSSFTVRACSERLPMLLKWYEQYDRKSKATSGISEEHLEKLDLLEEVKELQEEAVRARQTQQKQKSDNTERLNTARAIAMEKAVKQVAERDAGVPSPHVNKKARTAIASDASVDALWGEEKQMQTDAKEVKLAKLRVQAKELEVHQGEIDTQKQEMVQRRAELEEQRAARVEQFALLQQMVETLTDAVKKA